MLELRILGFDEIANFRKGIADLFRICFGQDLDPKIWDWAYQKNPTGNPVIAIALDEEKLVGHYAMIPTPFYRGNGHVGGYLSMTTMVHPNYRKLGLFVELASMAYAQAKPGTFVYGFPNPNSTPGFRNKLDWKISDEYRIATLDYEAMKEAMSMTIVRAQSEPCLFNEKFLEWRLSKPGARYFVSNNLIYKEHNGEIDVLTEDAKGVPSLLGRSQKYNILTKNQAIIDRSSSVKTYIFGYRNFDSKVDLESIYPNLLMSDVF